MCPPSSRRLLDRPIRQRVVQDYVQPDWRYHADETLLPPFDAALGGHVSAAYRQPIEINVADLRSELRARRDGLD
ncbi:hypothetical protein C9I57_13580 [Trinickia symbiotica]|uniref:Uncharacterized protein n=1 Tax=Trinickia symbiotica TaxID=863227 RepID=A0A2T3XUJ9_9BURK|nr:hypothetical protein [Trinickia symbiotica]PTB20132.1 hypothetical protein C9I57_13580 [Trinickia symbiotica]